MRDEEVRQESSLPLSARVPIVDLAEMVKYWESNGQPVRTVSQLVSWTVSLMVEVLKANGQISREDITVAEAYHTMEVRGLYQPKARERGARKLSAAIGLENIRMQGLNPSSEYPAAYNMLHRGGSASVLPRMSVQTLDKERQEKVNEVHAKAMELLEKQEVVPARYDNVVKSPLIEALDSIEKINVCPGPDEEITVKEEMSIEECEEHLRKSEECYNSVSDEELIEAMKSKVVNTPGK